jgi:hypothetical protein
MVPCDALTVRTRRPESDPTIGPIAGCSIAGLPGPAAPVRKPWPDPGLAWPGLAWLPAYRVRRGREKVNLHVPAHGSSPLHLFLED